MRDKMGDLWGGGSLGDHWEIIGGGGDHWGIIGVLLGIRQGIGRGTIGRSLGDQTGDHWEIIGGSEGDHWEIIGGIRGGSLGCYQY